MNFIKSMIKSLFSADDKNVSTLIICLLMSMTFSLTMYAIDGDISSNLLAIDSLLITLVAGVNVTTRVVDHLKNKNDTNAIKEVEMNASDNDADVEKSN